MDTESAIDEKMRADAIYLKSQLQVYGYFMTNAMKLNITVRKADSRNTPSETFVFMSLIKE